MKNSQHPAYNSAKVSCSCGNVWNTRSTASELKVEICSACHPFYTGVQRSAVAGGRIEQFKRRAALAGSSAS